MFSVFNIVRADYVASAVKLEQYPEPLLDIAEIAFIGRSNVGKSSLMNSLARRNGLARVSGTPGKTQTINFYRLTAKISEEERKDFFIVDLPGYGYARTGQAARRQWSKFIEEYLLHSPRLKMVCLLIDIRHAPMESDIDAYRWLVENGVPTQIVMTKADKVAKMGLKKNIDKIKIGLGMLQETPIAYSSTNGAGRDELLDRISQLIL